MKKLLFPLLLLAAGCHRDADVTPANVNANKAPDELEIVTQGRNRDCGVAQVLALDSARVRQVVGHSAYAPVYLALQLDTALWVRGSHTLLVQIRRPQPSEYIVCLAQGPGYFPFVVTSARLKPGTR